MDADSIQISLGVLEVIIGIIGLLVGTASGVYIEQKWEISQKIKFTDLRKAGIDIKEFVKDLTKRIRRDLAIDWTNNETIKARIRQNVRLLLLQKGFTELVQTERLIESIYQETVRVYREYLPIPA